ncbi:MAG TPA: hypothetical protein VEU62_20240 [Bryobacterales bacterium]|nr:hypothetical protein [Bryobacterales bacterium]
MTAITSALQGMMAASQQVDQVAQRVARTGLDSNATDSVDISSEAVQLLNARSTFEMEVKVAHIANELDKNLLNLLA